MNRAGKARILDEFCAVCGYHRKYAIRLLGRKKPASTSWRVGRKPRYDHPQLLEALRRIWIMRRIKGRTSSKLFEEYSHLKKRYWGRHFWARGYFCATVGQMTEEMVVV